MKLAHGGRPRARHVSSAGRNAKRLGSAFALGLGALLLGGCSSTTVSYGDPTETETVTATESPTEAPTESPEETQVTREKKSVSSGGSGSAARMPNVVCMNLQAAQDKIQEAGVFYSRSKDASGQGRMQVLDRNWIVVAQTPDPGTPISEGDAVLSVVKNDEPNSC